MSLDAATLALVAGELKNTLLDAKIDKIFEPTRDEVLMTLRTRTETHRLLLSARSGSARVCLTKESFENPLTPPGFCMLLRKHLTGGRLIELRREPGDRIVYFDFRCTNEMGDLVTNTLAVELMGRYSNLVLVQGGRIIDALKRVDFDDSEVRQLLPGLAYTLPPKPARPDFLETSAAAIVAAACEKDLPVAQALGKTVAGVGPVVVREAVCRALGETPALACDLTASCCRVWPTRCRPSPRGLTFWRRAPPPSWPLRARRTCPLHRRWARRWRASAPSSCGRPSVARWGKRLRWPAT